VRREGGFVIVFAPLYFLRRLGYGEKWENREILCSLFFSD